jgi:hypothetical protein
MIRINRGGLSDRERASVRRPLADNRDDGLEIQTLGSNLAVALDRYMEVFSEAVDSIDTVKAEK